MSKDQIKRCRHCRFFDPKGISNITWRSYLGQEYTTVCKKKPKTIYDTDGVYFYHVSPYQKACEHFSPTELC